MAIYTPRYFEGHDHVAAQRLIHDYPFATLITGLAADEPQITYIPMLLEGDALLGHIARPNPHWQHFDQGSTVALFHGPHAFVSPHWYEKPEDNVPTWNYAVVHVHGKPQVLDGADTLAHLMRLFSRFDTKTELPTQSDKVQRLLGGIVPFRMRIERMDVKFKMNQNKTAADRAGVIRGLRSTGRVGDAAVADWMDAK